MIDYRETYKTWGGEFDALEAVACELGAEDWELRKVLMPYPSGAYCYVVFVRYVEVPAE